ncbi:hypothetical protein [Marinobacter xiaoshiensis]|uniref:Acetyltransferase (GNAT) domain-containing protein n=1 Tax=Marinobacter xiaoshiensis TaxID=3073652 RepID=A0ABU2HI56_9GAMM|nr:hypothetical protein [Marinobacter sp. F60267]MDS1310746.1 hypothetical protein [Marinobacter sp. F60267]
MTKTLRVRAVKKTDVESIVRLRTSYQQQQQEALRNNDPDKFQFVYESDNVDTALIDAIEQGIYRSEDLKESHIFVIAERD